MSTWFHNLPLVWMAVVVFGVCYLVAAVIFLVVNKLAGRRAGTAFRNISPSLLSPLGVLFGLLIAFTTAQVWANVERATLAVDREASTLRSVVLLTAAFPGEGQTHLLQLVRRHIDDAVSEEWPQMADQSATIRLTPPALSDALQFAIALEPKNAGQIAAQKEMISSLENTLEARRERIIYSHSNVNWVKWVCLVTQALLLTIAIAMVHSENRGASAITVAIFTKGFAVSILLIASHDCPFTGKIAIKPDLLVQVRPDEHAPLGSNRD